MKNLTKKLLAAGIVALATNAVQAASVMFDTDTYGGGSSIGLTTTNWDTAAAGGPGPLVLPKWDPLALVGDGTAVLNSIMVSVRGDAEFEYSIENINAGGGTTGSNELLVDMAFTLPCASCSTGIVVSSGVLPINLSAFDGTIDFLPPSGVDFGVISDTFNDDVNIALANFGFYMGLGDFIIDVAAGSDSNRNISGGTLVEQTTWRAGAWAKVVYDYTIPNNQVPSPAPLALIAAGLLGLGASRRVMKRFV